MAEMTISERTLQWESTIPLPDQEFLQQMWQAEVDGYLQSLAAEEDNLALQRERLEPLLKAVNYSEDDIAKMVEQNNARADQYLKTAEEALGKIVVDIDTVQTEDLRLAEQDAARLETEMPTHFRVGYISQAVGWGRIWTGNAGVIGDISQNCLLRTFAHAACVGNYQQLAYLRAWLVFEFVPPIAGQSMVRMAPAVLENYFLFSDDQWWNQAYAKAQITTFVTLWQGNHWKPIQSHVRFNIEGPEIHPVRYGQFHNQCPHFYATTVLQGSPVKILAGMTLYVRARDFISMAHLYHVNPMAPCYKVPYVNWSIF